VGLLAVTEDTPPSGAELGFEKFSERATSDVVQQISGGRPSGLGEAYKSYMEVRADERGSDRAAVLKILEGAFSAPKNPKPPATLGGVRKDLDLLYADLRQRWARLIGEEGVSTGDPASGGAEVTTEVVPMWRADP
jgi:hypothetical protein